MWVNDSWQIVIQSGSLLLSVKTILNIFAIFNSGQSIKILWHKNIV